MHFWEGVNTKINTIGQWSILGHRLDPLEYVPWFIN